MKIDYSYQWFKEFCKAEYLPIGAILVRFELESARSCAENMKYAQKQIDHIKCTPAKKEGHWVWQEKGKQIALDMWKKDWNEWNQKRIESMLRAVEFAELTREKGKGFDDFLKREFERIGMELLIA